MHFDLIVNRISKALGNKWTCLAAFLFVLTWASFGPSYGYSDHWQMLINTSTTIFTFLMTFIILNSTSRDSMALHAKMDELIRSKKQARDEFRGLEEKTEEEIKRLKDELKSMEKEIDIQCD